MHIGHEVTQLIKVNLLVEFLRYWIPSRHFLKRINGTLIIAMTILRQILKTVQALKEKNIYNGRGPIT